MLAILLLAAAPASSKTPERGVIDLTVPRPCPEADEPSVANEIVVCAEKDRQERYRLRTDARPDGKALPKAEVRLSENATAAVETESADLGMARAQRAMVRFRIAF